MSDTETVAVGAILAVTVGLAAVGVLFGSILAIVAGLAATAVVLLARGDHGGADVCPDCGREIPDDHRQCGRCTTTAAARRK